MINDYPSLQGQLTYNEDSDNEQYEDDQYQDDGEDYEDIKPLRTNQQRHKPKNKGNINAKQKGHGLKHVKHTFDDQDVPSQVVRRRPKPPPPTSKPKAGSKCPTFRDESEDDESEHIPKSRETAESLVEKMSALGKKFCTARNAQRRMLMVSKLSKADLNLFGLVIKNIWEGEHGAFQLAAEEHRRLKPHKLLFKEYIMKRATFKRKREILLEGNILKNLTELMTQLEVE